MLFLGAGKRPLSALWAGLFPAGIHLALAEHLPGSATTEAE
jgi:hypothetical protein